MLMGMMIIVGFIVGFLVGCTGMGGIILIPALVYLAGLGSHVAMGTTLFTFIFTTSLCSWLYIRLGHVDWKATIPICIGGFLFTYVGADVKAFTAAPYLNLILALLILLAGQTLLMFVFTNFIVFRVMGRDYDAAVISSGVCGFGMGATPNAMANMQALCEKYAPSVKAYLLIPLVGSLFADFINSLVTTFFINFI